MKWGPHSIDRFADEHNHLLPRFHSRFWNPDCEAMDTFTRSWDFDNNWVCPPPHLVPRTLRHMRSCCAQGTLIVPLWRSAPFWPLLTTDGSHLAHFVEDWMDLPPCRRLFAWVATALVFLAERILILGFWLFVLISDLRGFLSLDFAIAIKVGALSVHLLCWVSVLFF